MTTRPPLIDADGHILDRDQDIRKHLPEPWSRRGTPLFPGDQPWDSDLFGQHTPYTRTSGVSYKSGMTPKEQVDAWVRIMDVEGFERAVCFPTIAGGVAKLQEKDFQLAVARACNDHFAKDYNTLSDRVHCVGVLPLRHPQEAAEELHRAVTELGLPSFELLTTGVTRALGDPTYDPIYAEAERLGVALSIHGTRSWAHTVGGDQLNTFAEVHAYSFPAAMLLHFTSIICQGVPVKFPKLRLAFLEIGATWIPYYLDRLDEHWEKRAEHEMPLLDRKPSQLVRESPLYFSIEAGESLLPAAIDYLGAEHYLYASDIPHWDNEFPESLEQVLEHPELSDQTKRLILAENARTLFGLPTPAGARA
jgi:predicted TIM-barrel fold metal-dependent hydrolase